MTTLDEMARQFGFNPAEMRGPDGRWLHVGAAVKHAEHGVGEVVDKHLGGKVSVRFGHGRDAVVKKLDRKELTSASGRTLGSLNKEAKARVREDRTVRKAEKHQKKASDRIAAEVLKRAGRA